MSNDFILNKIGGNLTYFGQFTDYVQMQKEWGNIEKFPFPFENEVIFASYGAKDYEGDAFVLFTHAGKLWEASGGHCSCYGLSESGYSGDPTSQWAPEETNWDALAMRKLTPDQHEPEAIAAFVNLVQSNLGDSDD